MPGKVTIGVFVGDVEFTAGPVEFTAGPVEFTVEFTAGPVEFTAGPPSNGAVNRSTVPPG